MPCQVIPAVLTWSKLRIGILSRPNLNVQASLMQEETALQMPVSQAAPCFMHQNWPLRIGAQNCYPRECLSECHMLYIFHMTRVYEFHGGKADQQLRTMMSGWHHCDQRLWSELWIPSAGER